MAVQSKMTMKTQCLWISTWCAYTNTNIAFRVVFSPASTAEQRRLVMEKKLLLVVMEFK